MQFVAWRSGPDREESLLTLKAPITTAADDIHKKTLSLFFRENKT